MTDLDSFLHLQTPTAQRPLLGLTILLVEDSLTTCEAMRLMCLRSGARIRRADCLESARRHLRVYRPQMVITDMSLPDGSGADLIAELVAAQSGTDVILGLSADPDQESFALAAGAHGFIAKPLTSITAFQQAILQYLPKSRHPKTPRLARVDMVKPDTVALQEDLAHALNLLNEGDETPNAQAYLTTFLSGVAQMAADQDLESVTRDFAATKETDAISAAQKAKLTAALAERLADRIAI